MQFKVVWTQLVCWFACNLLVIFPQCKFWISNFAMCGLKYSPEYNHYCDYLSGAWIYVCFSLSRMQLCRQRSKPWKRNSSNLRHRTIICKLRFWHFRDKLSPYKSKIQRCKLRTPSFRFCFHKCIFASNIQFASESFVVNCVAVAALTLGTWNIFLIGSITVSCPSFGRF